jgi:polysaccharide biosynthesis transport protein
MNSTMSRPIITRSPETEVTLTSLLAVARRRRGMLLASVGICFLLGVLVCVFSTRRYRAEGLIEIEKSSTDMLGANSMMPTGTDAVNDALNANLDQETQSEILQSDALALKVIEKLNLASTEDFRPKMSLNPLSYLLPLVTPKGIPDSPNASLEDSPVTRSRVLKVFSNHLKVKALPGTRLIQVRFLDSDRELAAAVVNNLTTALMDFGFQTRYAATNQSSEWLSGQLADLKKQAQDLEANVVSLQKSSGVYSLGTDPQGHDQTYSEVLDRLQQATTALTAATSNRIIKAAVLENVKHGDPELLSGLAGATLMGTSPGVQNSFTLLQTLRSQQAALQSQLAQDASKFGADYPKLSDEREGLRSVDAAIAAEVNRIGLRAKNDFEAAQTVENQQRQVYFQQKAEAEKLNNKAIEYGIARQEANDSRMLYDDIAKRLKEAGVLQGLHGSNITVVEPGLVPARPATPNIPLYLAISIFAGLFLGTCAVLTAEALDDKVHSISAVEQLTGTDLFGILPFVGFSSKLKIGNRRFRPPAYLPNNDQFEEESMWTFVEALRTMRTRLLLSRSFSPPKVILVTSALSGEGKSMVSAYLAKVLAGAKGKVLLVDADMRKDRSFKPAASSSAQSLSLTSTSQNSVTDSSLVERSEGWLNLSELLAGTGKGADGPEGDGVFVLDSGPRPPYPTDLLASQRMRDLVAEWRSQFDFVVLDSPPVLAVTDASVLAEVSDITLLLSRQRATPLKSLKRAYDLLQVDRVNRVGVVVNAVKTNSSSYDEYYGHSASMPRFYERGLHRA